MLEAILATINLDAFLIGLAGHVANDASAKLAFSAIKAFGPVLLGSVLGAGRWRPDAKRKIARRRKRQGKPPPAKCGSRRSDRKPSRGKQA